MQLTITLDDDQSDLLADWASIMRTLSQAQRICDGDVTAEEALDACSSELHTIAPALHAAQMAIREQVWKLQPDRSASRKRNRL